MHQFKTTLIGIWYVIQQKSFISDGEKNLTAKYLNLTRKDWLSPTVCDTYRIEDCDKFRAKIKYFKKDLMIDLSSFVSRKGYKPSLNMTYKTYTSTNWAIKIQNNVNDFVEHIFKNTLSKFIESNIDILQNKFNLNQASYMGLMKYYISTISKYETESSSSGKSSSAVATKAFSIRLLPLYCFILLFFI